MKRHLVAIGLVIAFSWPAWAGPEESAVQIARAWFQDDEAGVMGLGSNYGSGTVVWQKDGTALVLTCRHVVPDQSAYVWVRVGGRVHQAELVAVSESADLALLRVRLQIKAAQLADSEPAEGFGLRQWGHAKAGRAKPRAGPALGRDEFFRSEDGSPIHLARYACEPGDSGAGVFDPADRLVGVCSCRFPQFPDRTGYVPLSEVKRFLMANIKDK